MLDVLRPVTLLHMGKEQEPALQRLEGYNAKIKEQQEKARKEVKNLYYLHFAGYLTDSQSKRLKKEARGYPKPSAVPKMRKRKKKSDS